MSNNMYNTYDNCKFNYYTPSSFDNRTRDYLLSRYTPKAVWDYGDTVNIIFKLHECGVSDEEISNISGKNIRINFYNDRFELLPIENEIPATEEFTVAIDYDTSVNYFYRGTYYCSLQFITYNSDNEIETMETFLPMDRCCFYVQ